MSDPRKEPEERSSVVTGVRRKEVRQRLDLIAPLPSVPPPEKRNESGVVLQYMHDLHSSQREATAYVEARAEELQQEVRTIKVDIDDVKVHVMKLGGKVERLEDRVTMVANTQIAQNSELVAQKQSIIKLQETFESIIGNVNTRQDRYEKATDARFARTDKRMDDFERTFAQFRELIMADVEVRRHQVALEELKNGHAPETPRGTADDSSNPSGPTTVRPKAK